MNKNLFFVFVLKFLQILSIIKSLVATIEIYLFPLFLLIVVSFIIELMNKLLTFNFLEES